MAEGRMLKKQISQSRRLAELKTDSARLLYTWIIPHLDVEGRINADPDIIKGIVVPRISGITPGVIRECLLDMHRVGVITLYNVDGDTYLELRKFADHQSIRKDRESPSTIPSPTAGIPVQVQDNSGSTPAEVKLIEVKLIEDISLSKDNSADVHLPRPKKSERVDENFEEFWKGYLMPAGREKGSKIKARTEWDKLSLNNKQLAFYMEDIYLNETYKCEDGKYRVQPYIYLKERRWEQYEVPERIKKEMEGYNEDGKV